MEQARLLLNCNVPHAVTLNVTSLNSVLCFLAVCGVREGKAQAHEGRTRNLSVLGLHGGTGRDTRQ